MVLSVEGEVLETEVVPWGPASVLLGGLIST